MPGVAWHQFRETVDGVTCAPCGVEVDRDAEAGFFLPCPVPPCTVGDGDDLCVFVTSPDGIVCHFCGQTGGRR